MKKIQITRLSLENWRGVTVAVDVPDRITEFRAKNGVGKSTLLNAFVWLLTGADARDRNNFNLYDNREELTKDSPSAVAECELLVEEDGKQASYSLKRTAKSQWTRPRGGEQYVKSNSDKYEFYIDGVSVSAKLYNDRVLELFGLPDMQVLKMCVNPLYYTTLKWQDLRAMFQKIIGEVRESDFKGDYSLIKPLVDKHGFQLAKAQVQSRINDLKDRLKTLNGDIESHYTALPDLSKCDEAEALQKQKMERVEAIDKEMTGLSDKNKPYIEQRTRKENLILDKEKEIRKGRSAYEANLEASLDGIKEEINKARRRNQEIDSLAASVEERRKAKKAEIDAVSGDVEYISQSLDDARNENNAVKSRQFNAECPTCHQTLPDDMVAEAREKFLTQKEKDHKAVVERGRAIKARLEEREARLKQLQDELAAIEAPTGGKVDVSDLEAQLEERRAAFVPYEETDSYKNLSDEIKEIKDHLTVIPELEEPTELVAEKKALMSEIKDLSEVVAYRSVHKRLSDSISKKEEEQRLTTAELAGEEHKLYVFVEYERERAAIISSRVNQYLTYANVKMTDTQKNGEVTDCCIVTNGKVGGTINRAGEIQCQVDICAAFQKFYGIEGPVFVDDCDAIARALIPVTDGQQIRLRFDEDYEQITLVK
jgi:hypothetical protein